MANPHVTITLGRSGQKVVKETTGVSDGGILSTWAQLGSKRSLAESFGTSTDDSYYYNNNRTRGDIGAGSDIYNINLDDPILDPKDLRLKLTCKRISRRIELEIEERKKAELHEKVSRAIQSLESPERSLLTKIPSSGAAEPPKMDSISSSYTSQATNGAILKSPDIVAKYYSGFSIPRTAVDHQLPYAPSMMHIDASRTARFLISDPLESSAEGSLLTKNSSSRGAAEPPQMDLVSSSYTSRATSGERPQSSDRAAKYFNGFSTPSPRTAVDQLPYMPSMMHNDASRTARFLISDPLESSAEGSLLTKISSSRGVAEPPQMDLVSSSYTSRATSGERPQSSDRVAKYFNEFSTPSPRTAVDQLPYVPSMMHNDASRTARFLINDPLESSAEGSLLTKISSSRGAAEPPQMDLVSSSYTSWATSGERPQSSDRVAKYFNGFSTPSPRIAVDRLPHVPSIRPMDASRPAQFLISDPLDSSVPRIPLPTMSMAHVDSGKLFKELPPATGNMFKVPFMDILPPTVSSLLHSLGLGKYAINFQAEEIDMVALKQMGELDLKELGIPMGPRKKILSALRSQAKRPIV